MSPIGPSQYQDFDSLAQPDHIVVSAEETKKINDTLGLVELPRGMINKDVFAKFEKLCANQGVIAVAGMRALIEDYVAKNFFNTALGSEEAEDGQ